jgi:V8-like Glu-specific endopeptidase
MSSSFVDTLRVPAQEENSMVDQSPIAARIIQAIDAYDRPLVEEGCDLLVASIQEDDQPCPAALARKVVSALRRKKYFDLMERVADEAIRSGQRDPQLRRQYAQALIERRNLTAAQVVLTALAAEVSEGPTRDEDEHAEALGLLGRVFKQQYVNAVNRRTAATVDVTSQEDRLRRARINRGKLESAVRHYYTGFQIDPAKHYWHGINVVACLCRAQRDAIAIDISVEPLGIAREILTRLESVERKKVPVWDWATAIEACVAMGDRSSAIDWLSLYVNSADADAFEIASTLRQLEEVWELSPDSDPGDALLPVLRGELLKRETGETSDVSVQIESRALEALLSDERFESLKWYRAALQRCDAVARVEDAFGQPSGTAFLVRGEDFHKAFTGQVLVLTNAHVISDDPRVQKADPPAMAPERARLRFEARDSTALEPTYRVKLLWTSPPWELDATLLSLPANLPYEPPYPIAARVPEVKTDRVYVIGHPGGGTLSLSMQDNRVVDVKEPKLHYRAPTMKGSSGSPVFNRDWELVALHHAGSLTMPRLNGDGRHPANEGIWISAIIAALAKEWKAGAL